MIKVLIADDMQILRQGLKVILDSVSDIEVVATAENGREAFEKCSVYQVDVVLMDMRMPGYDGAYGITAIKEKMPNVKALVLTTFDDEETVAKALASGADGYILKEMDDERIINAIRNVYSGVSVFGQSVYNVMRRQMQKAGTSAPTAASPDVNLTEREMEVMKYVAKGYDNKEIAKEMFLAEGTVRNMISKILEKTELKDRTQLAVYAVKHGLDV